MGLLERISGAWEALNPPPVSASLELGQYEIPRPDPPPPTTAAQLEAQLEAPPAAKPAITAEVMGIPTPWEQRASGSSMPVGVGVLAGSGQLKTADEMIGRMMLPASVRQYPLYSDLSFLMAYGRMPMLRACASAKANALASLKWDYLSARTAAGRRSLEHLRSFHPQDRYGSRYRKREIRGIVKSGDAESLHDDHPAVAFFRRGVPGFLTGHQIEKLHWLYEIVVGESFNVLERDKRGQPFQQIPASPYQVVDIAKPDSRWFTIRGLYNGSYNYFEQQDVLYRKDPQLFNPFGRGSGSAQAVAMDLLLDDAMAKADYARWVNGGRPDMLILGLVASAEERERLELTYRSKFNGPDRAGKPWFVETDGSDNAWAQNVKVVEFSKSPKDLQAVQLRQLEQEIIRQTIGPTPPEVVGYTKNSNRATVDGAFYLYTKVAINPAAEQEENFRNEVVLPEFGGTIVAQFESAADEDHEHQLEVMKAGAWAFRKKYWFLAAGMEPEGTDDDEAYPVAQGQSFVDDLLEEPEPEPAATAPSPADPGQPGDPAADGTGKKPTTPPPNNGPDQTMEPPKSGEPKTPPTGKVAASAVARSAPERKAPAAIEALAKRLSPALRSHFAHAISDAQGKIDMVSLRAALSAGEHQTVIRILPLDRLADNVGKSEVVLRAILAEAGSTANRTLARTSRALDDQGFDPSDAAVAAWAAARSAELQDWIRQSATNVAQGVINDELRTGELSPDQAARAIKDRIGLTAPDSTAVANLRRSELQDGTDVETANERADLLAREKLADRAQTFGESQAFSAAQEGQRQAWVQALDRGLIPEGALRVWGTQEDARVCPICDPMDGQQREFGEPFTGEDGKQYLNPGDPHIDTCRCYAFIIRVGETA